MRSIEPQCAIAHWGTSINNLEIPGSHFVRPGMTASTATAAKSAWPHAETSLGVQGDPATVDSSSIEAEQFCKCME
jgi:hypothetical protein